MSSPTSAPPTQCKICDKKVKNIRGLGVHIARAHNVDKAYYYNTYINVGHASGKCLTCGVKTDFTCLTTGYRQFCSIGCSNKNPELAKQRTSNHVETLLENPDITKKAIVKFKQTLKDNPEIVVNRIEKFKETHRKDPSILEKRSEKFKATLAANPRITEEASRKRKETLAADPSIQINAAKKAQKTRSLPEFKSKISKTLSIARRDYYNRLSRSDGTMPCTIYLLAHSSLDIVKIGISTDLKKRMRLLQYHFGPMKEIKVVETTHAIASALEIEMLKHFKDHCEVQPHGGGRTEWFNSSITGDAVKFLQCSLSDSSV